jgi:predicted ATPase
MPIHESQIEVSRPDFLGSGSWKLSQLNSINVLLGRNGSGKSVLLRRLRDLAPASRHYIVPERTGEISFNANLILEVIDPARRQNRSQSNFSSDYRQEVITRIQAYYTKRGTKKRDEINHDPEDLIKSLNLILPDFSVGVRSETPFYALTRIRDGAPVASVSNLSSGESQLLSLGLDVLTITGIWELERQEKRMLLIDEPDAHIHPDLQIKFADFLCFVANEFRVQILVATHSTTLLSALGHFGKNDVNVLYLERDNATIVGQPVDEVSRELAAILGGHLVMGPLFAAPVLLVEGDDDYRVWVQVVRGGRVNVCVLPCNGDEIKRYQRTLERLFAALSDRKAIRGIALLDGDKPLPTSNAAATQDFIRFARLACHETENLYLSDEVLAELGHTWSTAQTKISAEAAKFGQKAPALLAVINVDRKNGEVKAVINELSEILDPKQLLWSVRLGKFIGRARPVGMLADFIGADVLTLLWGPVSLPAPSPAEGGAPS